MKKNYCLLMLLLVISITYLTGQESNNITRVSQVLDFWGNCTDMELVGNYVYIADSYTGLRIIDVSDPLSPQKISLLYLDYTKKIAVSGNYAFLGTINNGMHIVDITNPLAPLLAASIPFSGEITGIEILQNYVYLTVKDYGLRIYNLQNPLSPAEISSLPLPGITNNLTIQNGSAYLAQQEGMSIVNIANPANPQLTGSYTEEDSVTSITVAGNYAYLVTGNNKMKIVNLSTPNSPQGSGSYSLDNNLQKVLVRNNQAILLGDYNDLTVINIENSMNPEFITSYSMIGGHELCLRDTLIYIVSYGQIIRILGASDWASITELSGIYAPGGATTVTFTDNYAYVSCLWDGFYVINISDPANPLIAGHFDTNAEALWTAVKDNIAYVANSSEGLKIVDISDLENMHEISFYDVGADRVVRVTIKDNFAYLIYSPSHISPNLFMQILDITNPESPQLVYSDTSNVMCNISNIFFVGNYAFIGAKNGLFAVDITNPAEPQIVDSYPLTMGGKFSLCGNYAFIYSNTSTLCNIIDISNPNDLHLDGSYDFGDNSYNAMYPDDGFLTIWQNNSGLKVFNYDDVSNIYETGFYNSTSSLVTGLKVRNNMAYVAEGYCLGIYAISEAYANTDPEQINSQSSTLLQNYPNPFNPETTLSFSIPQDGKVELSIYNIKGQKVDNLVNSRMEKGNHKVVWSGKDSNNNSVSSGVYFSKLTTGGKTQVKKMLLMK